MSNKALADDIAVALGESFSDAIVVAFNACDDTNDALSLNQQKQVISSFMTVMLNMRDQVKRILDLDEISNVPFNNSIQGDLFPEDLLSDITHDFGEAE